MIKPKTYVLNVSEKAGIIGLYIAYFIHCSLYCICLNLYSKVFLVNLKETIQKGEDFSDEEKAAQEQKGHVPQNDANITPLHKTNLRSQQEVKEKPRNETQVTSIPLKRDGRYMLLFTAEGFTSAGNALYYM